MKASNLANNNYQKEKYEIRINELLKEVIYYQRLCTKLNEELIEINNRQYEIDTRQPVLLVAKGGIE